MPIIHVQLFEGRTPEQKRQLAQSLTDATVKSLGCNPDSVDVIIHEFSRENWATGGKLWSDLS